MPRDLPDEQRCTAHVKRPPYGRCLQPRMPGSNVCYYHGYSGGDPKDKGHPGNTHAMKSGRRETITWDTLTDEEHALWDAVPTDPETLLLDDIRRNLIRQRRMLQRIANLAGLDFLEVERMHQKGLTGEGMVDVLATKSIDVVERIQAIERDLTRVQRDHIKQIEVLFTKLTAAEDGALADLVASIERARAARSR